MIWFNLRWSRTELITNLFDVIRGTLLLVRRFIGSREKSCFRFISFNLFLLEIEIETGLMIRKSLFEFRCKTKFFGLILEDVPVSFGSTGSVTIGVVKYSIRVYLSLINGKGSSIESIDVF